MLVNTSRQRPPRWVIGLTAVALVAVALILFALVALDVALVLALCGGVFLVQRTAGDWLSEAFGASFGTLIFASVTAIFLWFVLMTSGGQSLAEQFLSAADERGFHTVFLQRQIVPPSSVRRLPGAAPGTTSPSTGNASETANPPPTETEAAAGTSGGSAPSDAVAATNENALPTQIALQLTTRRARVGQRVVARATVRAVREMVGEGTIVFVVNGRSQSVQVKDGVATIDIVEKVRGQCEVRAEYQGTRRFASSSAAPAVLIVD